MKNIRIITTLALSSLALVLINCDDKIKNDAGPVHASSAQSIYNGSIYYNQAGCASCHGTDLSAFKAKGKAGKTALDYFKSISGQNSKGLHQGESFQAFTDRGRWSMANYLISMAPPVQDDPETDVNEVRAYEAKLAQDAAEIRDAYARNNRRWPMGYKDIGSRPQSPELDSLLKDSNVVEENSAAPVSEARKEQLDRTHPGYEIYNSNCASCHGVYAAASATTVRFGLVACKDRNRQCGVYLGSRDLTAGGVKNAHNATGLNLPVFASFSEDDWSDISAFLATLADR